MTDTPKPMIKKRKELEEILEVPLPPGMVTKRNVYHGSNTKFDYFDFSRGGGW